MSWQADLRTRLLADATINTLTGGRIAWLEADRDWGKTYPQLVLQEVSTERGYTHDGATGLDRQLVQFKLLAEAGDDLTDLQDAIAAEMEQEPVTAGSTRFFMGFLQRGVMLPSEDLGNQRRVLGITRDYRFQWESTT